MNSCTDDNWDDVGVGLDNLGEMFEIPNKHNNWRTSLSSKSSELINHFSTKTEEITKKLQGVYFSPYDLRAKII